ncbi:alpha-(1-2)-phosphatidylinositol mannoside mannosyltransferase [Tessaracoccus lubricantis]|uniref:Alpha-(1-2)-phosphatidylinositol mannoside mannosyltransferase n=1 Tax=Tessaracoccus lubricantis TaxID=545543 RepID=A0ABP9F7L0_9ACTN
MPDVRPYLQSAVDTYLQSWILRGLAVVWLGWLVYGWLYGFPGEDFIPYRIDFDVYRIGGQVFRDGGELYGTMPETVAGISLPFTYPPIAAAIFSLLTFVSWRAGSVTLSALTVASMLVVLFLVVRELGANRRDSVWLTVALGCIALYLNPFAETVQFGQINAVLMALVMVDLLVGRGKWWQGSLIGLAFAIKLTPAVFLGWFLMRRDWRQLAVGVGSALLFTGVGFALRPADSWAYWTRVLPASERIGEPAYPSNQSLNGMLHRAMLGDSATWVWFIASVVIGLACLVVIRRLLQRGDDLTPAVVLGVYALVASPVSWDHHFVWAAPAMVLTTAWLWRLRRPWPAWAAAALTAAGLWIFRHAPHWELPHPPEQNPLWTPLQQVVGGAYFWWALGFLALAALCSREQLDGVVARHAENDVPNSP